MQNAQRMNLQDIQIFAESARLGSFAAVARARGSNPSSISRTIAGLEKDLGVMLFNRSTRKITLTEAGQLYLARVVPLVEEIDRLGAKARHQSDAPKGTLRLSAPIAFGEQLVAPHLAQFRLENPGLSVDCLLSDTAVDFDGARIDLAFLPNPPVDDALVSVPLCQSGTRLVASAAYARRHPLPLRPGELSRHECVLPEAAGGRAIWQLRNSTGTTATQDVSGSIAVSSLGGLLACVRAGNGVAALPGWLVQRALLDGELVQVLPDWDARAHRAEGAIWMSYPARDLLPQKTRLAMEFFRRLI